MPADDRSTCRYCLAEWVRSGRPRRSRFGPFAADPQRLALRTRGRSTSIGAAGVVSLRRLVAVALHSAARGHPTRLAVLGASCSAPAAGV